MTCHTGEHIIYINCDGDWNFGGVQNDDVTKPREHRKRRDAITTQHLPHAQDQVANIEDAGCKQQNDSIAPGHFIFFREYILD